MRNLIDLMCIYVSTHMFVCWMLLYAHIRLTYGVCIGMLVCTYYVYVTHRSASFSQKWNKLRWCSKTPSCFQFVQGLDSDL